MTTYTVLSGTSAITLMTNDAANVWSGGTVSGGVVTSGAVMVVYSGGTVENTSVTAGGVLIVLPGANIINIDAPYGKVITSDEVVVEASGVGMLTDSGTAYGPAISAGWGEFVLPAGSAYHVVNSGGFQFIENGGIAPGMTVEGGGFEIVSSGGIASNTVAGSGGTLIALSGSDIAGSIASGGQIISSGVVVIANKAGAFSGVSIGSAAFSRTSVGNTETAYVMKGGSYASAADHGTLDVFAGGAASHITVQSGATENVYAGGTDGNAVISGGGVQNVYSGGQISNSEVLPGGAIDLTYLAFAGGGSVPLSGSNISLEITGGNGSAQVGLSGDYNGLYENLSADTTGGTLIAIGSTPCFCAGTRIRTDRGEVPVEELAIGDRVINRKGEPRPIVWIGKRAYDGKFVRRNPDLQPILIRQNAFGPNALGEAMPARDLYVSPRHAFWFDGVLITANALVNGGSIRKLHTSESVTYFHVELATHDVILAEGALAESFLNDDNRVMFQNADSFHELYPDVGPEAAEYCAPRLEIGEVAEAMQRKLAARALSLGLAPPQTLQIELVEGLNRITVSPEVGSLILCSIPGYQRGDIRQLGALITRIRIDGAPIDLEDPRLTDGFYPVETHGSVHPRWTDGAASIMLDPRLHSEIWEIEVGSLIRVEQYWPARQQRR